MSSICQKDSRIQNHFVNSRNDVYGINFFIPYIISIFLFRAIALSTYYFVGVYLIRCGIEICLAALTKCN